MADMVRAVVQTGPRQMELREFPRPVIGPDDGALLRVEACGICGSDVEQYKGAMGTRGLPMIPGHEPLGIIEEIAPTTAARWGVAVGDRVAVEILIPCRSCDLCLAGQYMQCKSKAGSHGGYNPPERGLGLWGGYAEYMHLHPNSIVHRVRGDIPAEIAVMYNPLGAGVRWALQYGGVHLGSTVLVLGAGQRGLAAILAAKYVGAGLIIATGLARDARKLELAREFGADHTINVDEEDTVARVRELTGGDGVDVVLDLTPMAQRPILDAINAVRWGGTIVLAGLKGHQDIPIPTDMLINKALTVKGAFSVDAAAYTAAIKLIESGQFPLEKMQTHKFGLDDVEHAIKLLAGEIDGQDGIHVAVMPGL
ncbi:MAG TPA: zinc-binding dehydrogenase [Trebonia sp.]|jgi:threonine dehydrogenase-like Zn-dependent dehydrogenase|nr:zinc-binding dehydrogenase [Trebonia sp.]